ncbi:MAG: hypothetical protein JWO11_4086, partial [Nocardioides sp.]|nr:hypothetical protein [Nocardioides sp.]
MRRTLAVAVLTGLLLSLFAAVATPRTSARATSATMSPRVQAALASLDPGQTTTVLVTLREQSDLPELPDATRRARLKAVIQALHATANASQASLRARLSTQSAQGKVTETTPLWVVNAISVTATADVINELAARPDVARVTADDVLLVPAAGAPEPNQRTVEAPPVWDLGYNGQGVVVATLDSGVDVTNPDLASRWRGGTNSWFDPYGEHPDTPTDLSGHGTATMGAMVGGDAGGTTIGTAPGATWIAAKIFDDRGGATATAVHEAFQWLLDPDRNPNTYDAPQVVTGSWSIGSGPSCDLSFQLDVQGLRAAGILPVFAAGNFGPTDSTSISPANYPESLAVGAVSSPDLIYSASSRGPSTCGGRSGVFPDLVAPGVDILTADRYGLYQTVSGTSIAAPHVAGALALLLDAYPALTPDQQRSALVASARDLGPPGADDGYGHGRLDVLAAYDTVTAPPPPADFSVAVAPSGASTGAGGVASFDVQVTPVNGFVGDVTLSLSGLAAAQASWTFGPGVVAGGSGASQLVVTTSAATPPGDYPLTVTGTGGAISRTAPATLTVTPPPPPPPPPVQDLYLSTFGNSNPPGVAGTADDADIYTWNGTAYSRSIDVSAAPYNLPATANVDGFDRVDATHFYLSFSADTTVPGLGAVQDEDVVYFNAGTWSVYFDGTARGLTDANEDVDAISVAGGTLYFSTFGNTNPPGVAGTADDADVYSFNGTSFARVWDATANG